MISPSELQARLDGGESVATEFKEGKILKKTIAKLAVAFANSVDEGWMIFGVKHGAARPSIVGLQDVEKLARDINLACQEYCQPPLEPECERVVIEGKTVLVAIITADPGQRPYRTTDGHYTVRTVGGTTRVVSLIEEPDRLKSGRTLLASVTVRHFLSLYDVNIRLKPITLIIGPNATGKSNLFKALQFLRDGMTGDISEWENYTKRIEELVWFGHDAEGGRPERMTFELSVWLRNRLLSEAFSYQVDMSWKSGRVRVENERLAKGVGNNSANSFFERNLNEVSLSLTEDTRQLQERRSLFLRSPERLFFREYLSSYENSPADAFVQFVQGWRFINVDVEKARQGTADVLSEPQDIPTLRGDGSNLAEVLYALSVLDRERFNEISERLGRSIGFPSDIGVRNVATLGSKGEARITFAESAFQDHVISPASVSDGTIRLLTLLTALIGDPRATLICIEEPDQGLHPHLLLRLADVMRTVVAGRAETDGPTPPQIITTTHSPELMDCFDVGKEASYVQVLVAERDVEDGKTRFQSSTAKEFAPWLEQYRLGEAVRRNVFGTAR